MKRKVYLLLVYSFARLISLFLACEFEYICVGRKIILACPINWLVIIFLGLHDSERRILGLLEKGRPSWCLAFYCHSFEGGFGVIKVLNLPFLLQLGRQLFHATRRVVGVKVGKLKRENNILQDRLWKTCGWVEYEYMIKKPHTAPERNYWQYLTFQKNVKYDFHDFPRSSCGDHGVSNALIIKSLANRLRNCTILVRTMRLL